MHEEQQPVELGTWHAEHAKPSTDDDWLTISFQTFAGEYKDWKRHAFMSPDGMALFKALIAHCREAFKLSASCNLAFVPSDLSHQPDELRADCLYLTHGTNQLVFYNPANTFVIKCMINILADINRWLGWSRKHQQRGDRWFRNYADRVSHIRSEYERVQLCIPARDRVFLGEEVIDLRCDGMRDIDPIPILHQNRGLEYKEQTTNHLDDDQKLSFADDAFKCQYNDTLLVCALRRMVDETGYLLLDANIFNFALFSGRLVCIDAYQAIPLISTGAIEPRLREQYIDIVRTNYSLSLLTQLHRQGFMCAAQWLRVAYRILVDSVDARRQGLTKKTLLENEPSQFASLFKHKITSPNPLELVDTMDAGGGGGSGSGTS